MKKKLTVIAHNMRSIYNVGSLFRTCEGLGVERLILSGHTPYPKTDNDDRLPHVQNNVSKRLHKTALGAESYLAWDYEPAIEPALKTLKSQGYEIVALEQANDSIDITNFKPSDKTALILGNEPDGIDTRTLSASDKIVEIPMSGYKESLNVTVAAAIAVYRLLHL